MNDLNTLAKQLENGSTTSQKLVEASLEKIKETSSLNAFISVLSERAMQKAEEADKRRAEGKVIGKLDGIPVAIKDNLCLYGTKTTAGSKMLANFEAPYSATAIEKLEAAGAVIVGKTNMDEIFLVRDYVEELPKIDPKNESGLVPTYKIRAAYYYSFDPTTKAEEAEKKEIIPEEKVEVEVKLSVNPNEREFVNVAIDGINQKTKATGKTPIALQY